MTSFYYLFSLHSFWQLIILWKSIKGIAQERLSIFSLHHLILTYAINYQLDTMHS